MRRIVVRDGLGYSTQVFGLAVASSKVRFGANLIRTVGHFAQACTETERLCYNCKTPGHESSACPNPRTAERQQCYHCQDVGHVQVELIFLGRIKPLICVGRLSGDSQSSWRSCWYWRWPMLLLWPGWSCGSCMSQCQTTRSYRRPSTTCQWRRPSCGILQASDMLQMW